MTKSIDTIYYSRRIAQERKAAERSADPLAQRLHSELAERYVRIVGPTDA